VQEEIDELSKTSLIGVLACEKSGFDLIEFEEFVRDDGGLWLTFSKLPITEPVQQEEAKGKKPPPKGKATQAEEAKPVFGKAWIDLTELRQPGSRQICKRVDLSTCPPAVKEVVDGQEVWHD
jgi:hypothetical protein